ncbi:RNA-directed DNA polymerase, eukaryota, reverse transcriptase zinc-binding domain protein [Tanacetum coccineum]
MKFGTRIIKEDVLKAVSWFSEKAKISKACNASFVTLVPNVVDPLGLGDFRPISIIGSIYKIIEKILAKRVKRVIGKIIGEVQNAFIEGRYILDGVLIANETMEFLKQKKMKGIIFKVDFEKAYDSINWSYLMEIIERMRFGSSRENACNLMNVLKCFEDVAGLKINLRKSKVYGVGVDGDDLDRMTWFNQNREDKWKRRIDPNEVFSVRSLARWIKERRVSSLVGVIKTGWNKMVPIKINVFVWRAVLGRIPVWVELDKKGIDLDSILCPSCDNVVKSIVPCLVLCEKALSVWDRFAWWEVGPVDAFTLNDMICHRGGVRMEKAARVLWEVVVLVAAYYIWKSKNLRVFKAKNESSSKVFQDIQIKTFEWINRRSKKHKFPSEKWVVRPALCGKHQLMCDVAALN